MFNNNNPNFFNSYNSDIPLPPLQLNLSSSTQQNSFTKKNKEIVSLFNTPISKPIEPVKNNQPVQYNILNEQQLQIAQDYLQTATFITPNKSYHKDGTNIYTTTFDDLNIPSQSNQYNRPTEILHNTQSNVNRPIYSEIIHYNQSNVYKPRPTEIIHNNQSNQLRCNETLENNESNNENRFNLLGEGTYGKVYKNLRMDSDIVVKSFNNANDLRELEQMLIPLYLLRDKIVADPNLSIVNQRFNNYFVLPLNKSGLSQEYKNKYDSKFNGNYLLYQNVGSNFSKFINKRGFNLDVNLLIVQILDFISNYDIFFNTLLNSNVKRIDRIYHFDIKNDNVMYDGKCFRLIDYDFLMPLSKFMTIPGTNNIGELIPIHIYRNDRLLKDFIKQNIFYFVYNPYLVVYKYYKTYYTILRLHNLTNWNEYWQYYTDLVFHNYIPAQSEPYYEMYMTSILKHIEYVRNHYFYDSPEKINEFIQNCESENSPLILLDNWGILNYITSTICFYCKKYSIPINVFNNYFIVVLNNNLYSLLTISDNNGRIVPTTNFMKTFSTFNLVDQYVLSVQLNLSLVDIKTPRSTIQNRNPTKNIVEVSYTRIQPSIEDPRIVEHIPSRRVTQFGNKIRKSTVPLKTTKLRIEKQANWINLTKHVIEKEKKQKKKQGGSLTSNYKNIDNKYLLQLINK